MELLCPANIFDSTKIMMSAILLSGVNTSLWHIDIQAIMLILARRNTTGENILNQNDNMSPCIGHTL